jgi:hypothetical protein
MKSTDFKEFVGLKLVDLADSEGGGIGFIFEEKDRLVGFKLYAKDALIEKCDFKKIPDKPTLSSIADKLQLGLGILALGAVTETTMEYPKAEDVEALVLRKFPDYSPREKEKIISAIIWTTHELKHRLSNELEILGNADVIKTSDGEKNLWSPTDVALFKAFEDIVERILKCHQ